MINKHSPPSSSISSTSIPHRSVDHRSHSNWLKTKNFITVFNFCLTNLSTGQRANKQINKMHEIIHNLHRHAAHTANRHSIVYSLKFGAHRIALPNKRDSMKHFEKCLIVVCHLDNHLEFNIEQTNGTNAVYIRWVENK